MDIVQERLLYSIMLIKIISAKKNLQISICTNALTKLYLPEIIVINIIENGKSFLERYKKF